MKQLHKIIQSYVFKNTLPLYIQMLYGNGYAPVITGGMAALRCGASKLTRHIFSPDIDINIVFEKDKRISNESLQKRDAFVKAIIQDSGLLRKCTKHKVSISIDKSMLELPVTHEAFNSRVVRIRLTYENGSSIVLLDTSMYDRKSKKGTYMTYFDFFKCGTPIPYQLTSTRVPIATCDFVIYDTIRMISYYLKEIKSDKRGAFSTLKLAYLLMKFIALLDDKANYEWYYYIKKQIIDLETIPNDSNDMLIRVIEILKKTTTLNQLRIGKKKMIEYYRGGFVNSAI